jgi:multiple sugar transport system substrate-binding protein
LTENSNLSTGKASHGGKHKTSGRASRALLAAGSVVGMVGVPAVQASAASPIVLTETSYYDSYASNGPIYNYMNTIFSGFEKTHPGIIIKREDLPPNGSYFTKIVDEAASNTLPDILMVDNPDLPVLASYGVLTNLSALGSTVLPNLEPTQQGEAQVNGGVYGYPLYDNTIALFYNKDMLAAAHVQPPKTWAQLLTAAKALTNSQHYGLAWAGQPIVNNVTWQFLPFLLTNGGSLTHLTSPQSVAALTLWTNLWKEGAVDKDALTWTQSQPNSEFITDKAAMEIMGCWQLTSDSAVKGLNFGVEEIPVNTPGQVVQSPVGGEIWTVPKSNPATEKAALELLNYMAKPSVDAALGTNTGDIPTVKAAVTIWAKTANPLYQPFEQELQHGFVRAETLGTAFPRVDQAVANAIAASLIGKQTPAAAFGTAQQEVNSILSGA